MRSPKTLVRRVPFFYGWVIVGCAMCANFSRQGAAVATLSIFAVPMTAEFDWSRTAFSGAVSLGGLLGALISPKVGVFVDRRGSGQVLAIGTLLIGMSAAALSQTNSLIWFYVAFCLGRMSFSGPFEIAVTSAVANWFIVSRGRAMSLAALAHSIGLTVLPIISFAAIAIWNWRVGWFAVATVVLLVGILPNIFLMVHRPEDVGLQPFSNRKSSKESQSTLDKSSESTEYSFTRREASRTRTFWILVVFSIFIYPVQAGVSLHQAPHLIERGISLGVAATAVSSFSFMSAIGGLAFGQFEVKFGARKSLSFAAALMAIGTVLMILVIDNLTAYMSAMVFGAGIGGLMTLLPVAWADSFGRQYIGSIRGITVPLQTLAQASGPLISGALYDLTGGYDVALRLFCVCSLIAMVMALFAVKPEVTINNTLK